MDDNYTNVEECNLNKNCKIFIAFDNMFADMLSNKKTNPIVTELFNVGRNLDIDFKESMNLYKICTAKAYFFSYWCYFWIDNLLRFRKNILRRI